MPAKVGEHAFRNVRAFPKAHWLLVPVGQLGVGLHDFPDDLLNPARLAPIG